VLDPTVSRRHAELAVEPAGITVRDLGSSNGTFYQGVRTTEARLTPGDRIVFGKVSFELRQLAQAENHVVPASIRKASLKASFGQLP
jgi:pSer/pThr/pTyr-binding forkhead associated (FHA) protein